VFIVGLPPLAAKLVGIAIAFIVNFLINLRIVFRTRPESTLERLL
jgi:putative flippase GtrA